MSANMAYAQGAVSKHFDILAEWQELIAPAITDTAIKPWLVTSWIMVSLTCACAHENLRLFRPLICLLGHEPSRAKRNVGISGEGGVAVALPANVCNITFRPSLRRFIFIYNFFKAGKAIYRYINKLESFLYKAEFFQKTRGCSFFKLHL